MRKTILLSVVMVSILVIPVEAGGDRMSRFYEFEMKNINGQNTKLSDFQGKVILVVNVASKCGSTPQYEGLQKIYDRFKEKGFVILGFPANNFKGQEPGTDEEIKQFCSLNYGVTFPMFSKISVRGEDQHPLYQYLTGKENNHEFGGVITWNFNKFLLDRKGDIVARFGTKVLPESEEILSAIHKYLEDK